MSCASSFRTHWHPTPALALKIQFNVEIIIALVVFVVLALRQGLPHCHVVRGPSTHFCVHVCLYVCTYVWERVGTQLVSSWHFVWHLTVEIKRVKATSNQSSKNTYTHQALPAFRLCQCPLATLYPRLTPWLPHPASQDIPLDQNSCCQWCLIRLFLAPLPDISASGSLHSGARTVNGELKDKRKDSWLVFAVI